MVRHMLMGYDGVLIDHPYMKDEFGGQYLFRADPDPARNPQGVYTDRLFQWDSKKFDECAQKVWGNHGQYFDSDRTRDQLSRFLSLYLGREVEVFANVRYTNQATGFPVWRLDYQDAA